MISLVFLSPAGITSPRSQLYVLSLPSNVLAELESRGIFVQAQSYGTVTEEAPGVYKDVNDVVDVVSEAGLSKRVCRMRPIGVVKG